MPSNNPSDLQAYLAAKYLSGPKANAILSRASGGLADSADVETGYKVGPDGKRLRKKKKIRSDPEGSASGSGTTLRIKDDLDEWKRSNQMLEDDEDTAAQVSSLPGASKGGFKKVTSVASHGEGGKKNGKSRATSDTEMGVEDVELDQARATIDQTPDDEQPNVAGSNGLNLDLNEQAHWKEARNAAATAQDGSASASSTAKETGEPTPQPKIQRSGLMTRQEIQAEQRERKLRDEMERLRANAQIESGNSNAEQRHTQTVYRDRSGRKIDVDAEEAAQRAEAARKERIERERKEWGKGTVQRTEAMEQAKKLREAKTQSLARYANDERMNDELRAMARNDDPAMGFLTKRRDERKGGMPRYTGPPGAPNRFGIMPGYRWDGVDRSNGFEKMYFAKVNQASTRNQQAHGEYIGML